MKKNKAVPGTFRKVLKRIRSHWLLLAVSILCAAANVFLTLYIPVLNGRAIDSIIGKGQVDFEKSIQLAAEMNVRIFTAELFCFDETRYAEVAGNVGKFLRNYLDKAF